MYDMDRWMDAPILKSPTMGLTTLDLFDPFCDLDRMMSRNIQWMDRPIDMLKAIQPIVPRKYRITIDCAGYNPESITTTMREANNHHHLDVHALEETGKPNEKDYIKKEMKKSYTLPKDVVHDQMVSFMTPGGTMVIEFPLKTETTALTQALLPQIVGNEVKMSFQIPDNVDPSKVHISLKDRDVIMKVEDKIETPDSVSRVHIYNKTTLPENTDLNNLKCIQENNQIRITAPINLSITGKRNIPIQQQTQPSIQQK